MRKALVTAIAAGIGVAGLAGCGGGGDSTTVIEKAAPAPQTVTETVVTKAQKAAPPETPTPAPPQAAPSEPPDVVGLSLPEAKKQLSAAGFRADPTNTDTAFGIVVEANFTVCEQSAPKGKVVPILAQKYGC